MSNRIEFQENAEEYQLRSYSDNENSSSVTTFLINANIAKDTRDAKNVLIIVGIFTVLISVLILIVSNWSSLFPHKLHPLPSPVPGMIEPTS